jgi:hypothetical protein
MQLKKYIWFSPHALRSYRLFASWHFARQFPAAGKNTFGFRQKKDITIDSSARGNTGSEKC